MRKRNSQLFAKVIPVLAPVLLIVCSLILEWGFIGKILRLSEMRLPYVFFYSVMISGALFWTSINGARSIFFRTVLGFFSGQIAATIALTLANLFIVNGLKRNLASLQRDGFLELFLTDFAVAFFLGGWLLGGLAFLFSAYLKRKSREPGGRKVDNDEPSLILVDRCRAHASLGQVFA